jgi:hypothetical protein
MDNLKTVSLTRLHRERQEILSYENLEKNIRDELQAFNNKDFPSQMKVGNKEI